MARLDPLIRVRKHAVDEKQRVLADLYRQAEALRAEKERLLLNLAREQALVEADITNLDARVWLGTYAAGVQKKSDQIDAAIQKLDTRIMIATDDMRTAFAELKKIEITDRERKKRERKKQNDRDSQELDAIGIENFRRQDGET